MLHDLSQGGLQLLPAYQFRHALDLAVGLSPAGVIASHADNRFSFAPLTQHPIIISVSLRYWTGIIEILVLQRRTEDQMQMLVFRYRKLVHETRKRKYLQYFLHIQCFLITCRFECIYNGISARRISALHLVPEVTVLFPNKILHRWSAWLCPLPFKSYSSALIWPKVQHSRVLEMGVAYRISTPPPIQVVKMQTLKNALTLTKTRFWRSDCENRSERILGNQAQIRLIMLHLTVP